MPGIACCRPKAAPQPMGRRIVQIPKDPFRTNIRDPKSGFIVLRPQIMIAAPSKCNWLAVRRLTSRSQRLGLSFPV